MHLIPLPFADDMRAVPEQFLDAERGRPHAAKARSLAVANCCYLSPSVVRAAHCAAPQDLTKKAALFVSRLAVKGGYSPDSYPNPGG